jgi:hypothetical protein
LSAKTKAAPPIEEIVDWIPMLDAMADAPRDGRWIEVTEDGEHWRRARFYQTRMRTAGSVAWALASCWSTSEPSRYMHRVQNPVAWRWPVEATPAV